MLMIGLGLAHILMDSKTSALLPVIFLPRAAHSVIGSVGVSCMLSFDIPSHLEIEFAYRT